MHRLAVNPRAQTGATLIEVLVTVIVITLGVVAMASLQVSALKLGQGAYLRSQAVALGYEMLDTMRANRTDVLAGRYEWTLGAPPPAVALPGATAQHHIKVWLANIERALAPYNGQGAIACIETRCTLTIRWDDRYASERAGPGQPRFEEFRVVADL